MLDDSHVAFFAGWRSIVRTGSFLTTKSTDICPDGHHVRGIPKYLFDRPYDFPIVLVLNEDACHSSLHDMLGGLEVYNLLDSVLSNPTLKTPT